MDPRCPDCELTDCPRVSSDPYWPRCPAQYVIAGSKAGREGARALNFRMAERCQKHAAECYAAARDTYSWLRYSADAHRECLHFQRAAARDTYSWLRYSADAHRECLHFQRAAAVLSARARTFMALGRMGAS